jgi:hypothetical protein
LARPKTPICPETQELISAVAYQIGTKRLAFWAEVDRSTVTRWVNGTLAVPVEKIGTISFDLSDFSAVLAKKSVELARIHNFKQHGNTSTQNAD